MFDITKFTVHVSVEKVTRIPYPSGNLFVRWNVPESPRPDAHGRTPTRPIHGTEASFKYKANFSQRIGHHYQSRLLRSCSIKFEVVWEPIGGRGVTIGTLTLDLSQFAQQYKRHHEHKKDESASIAKYLEESKVVGQNAEVAGKSLLYLLRDAKNNSLLEVSILLEHNSGMTDYRKNDFTGPAVNYNNHDFAILEDSELNSGEGGSQRSREKLRKLKRAVFQDLSNEDHMHSSNNAERDWLDIDKFLLGEKIDLRSEELDAEFKKYGIRDVSESSTASHGRKTPYLETDIREHFINLSVMPT